MILFVKAHESKFLLRRISTLLEIIRDTPDDHTHTHTRGMANINFIEVSCGSPKFASDRICIRLTTLPFVAAVSIGLKMVGHQQLTWFNLIPSLLN